MRINVQLFEDARGGRAVQAALYLHGKIDWPSGPIESWSKAPPRKAVDTEPRLLGMHVRPLANLDLMAPDDADESHVEDALSALRSVASTVARGTWVEREGVAAKFLLAERGATEAEAILTE